MAQAEQPAQQPTPGDVQQQSPPQDALEADVTPPAEGGPAQVSKRGGVVLKLADWMTNGFRCTIGEGDQAQQVLVTAEGVRVNRAQADAIKLQAAAHGVALTEKEA